MPSPYFSSLVGPIPFTRRRAARVAGRDSAMAARVESCAITYAGMPSSRAIPARHSRRAAKTRIAVVAGSGGTHPRDRRATEVADAPGSADVEQEPALLAATLATAGLAALRPREREVDAGPRDPDVEEAPLLGEGGVVVERLADRQRALLEHRQEHRVPLEALRPVVGQEVDAVGCALAFVRGALAQRSDDTRDIGRWRSQQDRGHDLDQRLQRGLPLLGLASLGRRRAVLFVPHLVDPSPSDIAEQRRPRRIEPRAPQARDRPLDLRPVVEADAAHLVGEPGPGQRRLDRLDLGVHPDQHGDLGGRDAVADQPPHRRDDRRRSSASADAYFVIVGSGPPARSVVSRFDRPSAAISRLASSRTCGVER